MSASGKGLDASIQHLLDVVAKHRDEQCAAIQANAEAEAKVLLHTAWREARVRLHNDTVETRQRIESALASHEAQQQTRHRQQRQARDEALLAAAREALRTALLARWLQPASRQQWCEALVDAAAATLEAREWVVEHPTDWPVSEHEALLARIKSRSGKTPRLQAHAGISAGLRICAGSTCMDATLDGLLHDRARIDAELLALCAERAGGGA
jgi:Asp-tRNA(Asn)/Glu-tRNA(Gln) amidotransferase A subunit family amidase